MVLQQQFGIAQHGRKRRLRVAEPRLAGAQRGDHRQLERRFAPIGVPSDGVGPPSGIAEQSSMRSAPPRSAASTSSTEAQTISSRIFRHTFSTDLSYNIGPPRAAPSTLLRKSQRLIRARWYSCGDKANSLVVGGRHRRAARAQADLRSGVVERFQNKVLQPGPYPVSAEADALQRTLLVADLHTDSLLWGRNLLDRSSRGHVDIPRLLEGNASLVGVYGGVHRAVPPEHRAQRRYVRYAALDRAGAGLAGSALFSPKGRALYQAKRIGPFRRRIRRQARAAAGRNATWRIS